MDSKELDASRERLMDSIGSMSLVDLDESLAIFYTLFRVALKSQLIRRNDMWIAAVAK